MKEVYDDIYQDMVNRDGYVDKARITEVYEMYMKNLEDFGGRVHTYVSEEKKRSDRRKRIIEDIL